MFFSLFRKDALCSSRCLKEILCVLPLCIQPLRSRARTIGKSKVVPYPIRGLVRPI